MAVLTTGRLPLRLTPLAGRDAELGEVTRELGAFRLLTLTSPGGAGKTRLALAAAAARASVADVAWVDLAPLDSPQVVAATVATRLGVPEVPGADAAEAVVAYLAAARMRILSLRQLAARLDDVFGVLAPPACKHSAAWPASRAGTPGPRNCTTRALSLPRRAATSGRKPPPVPTSGSSPGSRVTSARRRPAHRGGLGLREAARAVVLAGHVVATGQGATRGRALARPNRKQLGNALHTALRELRRALGDPEWVVYSGGRYSFNRRRPHECDVDTFESALAAASRARPASAALPDLQRAVAVYGGDFLAGMTTGEWAHARRGELRRRFESALLAVGRVHAGAGRYQAAVTAFRRAVEHEPLNESAHRELMTCWSLLGETARAVRHYAELEALLAAQLGVAPAAKTTALYRRLAGGAGASADRIPERDG